MQDMFFAFLGQSVVMVTKILPKPVALMTLLGAGLLITFSDISSSIWSYSHLEKLPILLIIIWSNRSSSNYHLV